jgi:malignant T-cell-amplified sequence
MFKKFDPETSIAGTTELKKSKAKKVVQRLKAQYPLLDEKNILDEVFFPNLKKKPLKVVNLHGRIQLLLVDTECAFYSHRDGSFVPCLHTLYKYPGIMTKVQVDKGAIRHILRGSDVMCPGLTSAGGSLPEETKENADKLKAGEPVAIYCEGKVNPVAVGLLKMSIKDIKEKNEGIGIHEIHHLDDGLWQSHIFD